MNPQIVRKVVDKCEKDCSAANLGYSDALDDDYKLARAEFGDKMKSRLIGAMAQIVKAHKGVILKFFVHQD